MSKRFRGLGDDAVNHLSVILEVWEARALRNDYSLTQLEVLPDYVFKNKLGF